MFYIIEPIDGLYRFFVQQTRESCGLSLPRLSNTRELRAIASSFIKHARAAGYRFFAQQTRESCTLPLPRSSNTRELLATTSPLLFKHARAVCYRFPVQQTRESRELLLPRSTNTRELRAIASPFQPPGGLIHVSYIVLKKDGLSEILAVGQRRWIGHSPAVCNGAPV